MTNYGKLLVEKVGKTVLYAFIAVAFAGGVGQVTDVPWWDALVVGLGAGVLSLLTSLVTDRVPGLDHLSFWPAVGVRVVKTFLQSLLAILVGSSGAIDLIHAPWTHALNVAAGAALLSLVGSVASAGVTSYSSPSLVVQAAPAVNNAVIDPGSVGSPHVAEHDAEAPLPLVTDLHPDILAGLPAWDSTPEITTPVLEPTTHA